MAEERFGSIFLARTDAGNNPVSESRPAVKSGAADGLRESSRPTSGATSLDLAPEDRRSNASRPQMRGPYGTASESASYRDFRRICDELLMQAKRADDYLVDARLGDTGMEVVVEVEQLLDELYSNTWGTKECLKRIVLAIGSQIYNVAWTQAHVAFLKDVVRLLRISYLIDDSLVEECLKLIRVHGLEVFRGTIAETEVRKKYRIEEVH